ncbi:hypothetical protein NE237_032226 [Protea cynaroides]|uniref:Uncharacterized protein n=1 Tax=Protea cynaroides TaxID=273540 RepID=A0A9Q0R373_9MAGN|nr:hypothetical protein NE237_032226 [Protea cynaroides]
MTTSLCSQFPLGISSLTQFQSKLTTTYYEKTCPQMEVLQILIRKVFGLWSRRKQSLAVMIELVDSKVWKNWNASRAAESGESWGLDPRTTASMFADARCSRDRYNRLI